MPRNLSPTFIAQLASSGVSAPVLFVKLQFANETLYLFGGVGKLTPAGPAYSPLSTFPYGQTFTGLGWLAKVSTIPQTTKVQAQGITLSLSGIPSELVLDAVNQVRISGVATVWLGFFNLSAPGTIIEDPVQLFAGALDVPTLTDSGSTCTISITAENPLIMLQEAPSRLFDDADQQIYVPGDLGLSFVDYLANAALFWPSPYVSGSPYPIDMQMIPNGADVAVGGTIQLYVQINYSDGSYCKQPGRTGSGTLFIPDWASSDPSVALVSDGGVVLGKSPGVCNITTRVPYPLGLAGSTAPGGQYRAACGVIVHN